MRHGHTSRNVSCSSGGSGSHGNCRGSRRSRWHRAKTCRLVQLHCLQLSLNLWGAWYHLSFHSWKTKTKRKLLQGSHLIKNLVITYHLCTRIMIGVRRYEVCAYLVATFQCLRPTPVHRDPIELSDESAKH